MATTMYTCVSIAVGSGQHAQTWSAHVDSPFMVCAELFMAANRGRWYTLITYLGHSMST